MQASLTFPSEGELISGDNPVYLGNVGRGESRTVNWTLAFNETGIFLLDVNASGYRVDFGTYVEVHGYAVITVHMIYDIVDPFCKVDMKDIGTAAKAFGSEPGDPLWNPSADITGLEYGVPDGQVDMRDISLIARHFGEEC